MRKPNTVAMSNALTHSAMSNALTHSVQKRAVGNPLTASA